MTGELATLQALYPDWTITWEDADEWNDAGYLAFYTPGGADPDPGSPYTAERIPTSEEVVATIDEYLEEITNEHHSSPGAHFPYDDVYCPACNEVRRAIFQNAAAGREP